MDLQAAYVMEIETNPEVADEIRRLRSLIQGSARQLQALSSNFWNGNPNLIEYSAKILVEDFRERLLKQYPEWAAKVKWGEELPEQAVSIDIEMFFGALVRIFDNAFAFAEPDGEIKAGAYLKGERLVFELTETKKSVASDPQQWGVEPFLSTQRHGYGLGLFRARRLLALHRAELEIAFDPERQLLTTKVSLPLASTA